MGTLEVISEDPLPRTMVQAHMYEIQLPASKLGCCSIEIEMRFT